MRTATLKMSNRLQRYLSRYNDLDTVSFGKSFFGLRRRFISIHCLDMCHIVSTVTAHLQETVFT